MQPPFLIWPAPDFTNVKFSLWAVLGEFQVWCCFVVPAKSSRDARAAFTLAPLKPARKSMIAENRMVLRVLTRASCQRLPWCQAGVAGYFHAWRSWHWWFRAGK